MYDFFTFIFVLMCKENGHTVVGGGGKYNSYNNNVYYRVVKVF